MDVERTADTAERADRRRHRLALRVPRAGLAHRVLAHAHERTGGTDADAVAAVDARGVGESDVELGRDASVEPASRHRDREGVLRVGAARLDTFVAEDAARVVADV